MTLTYSGELTILTCWCGIKHAVPSELRNYQLREHDDGNQYAVFCPLGHEHVPGGRSKAKELEAELAAAALRHERELTATIAALDQTKAELREKGNECRAEKAAKTRLAKRAANGVCPCCKRSFINLHRHMRTKHPKFAMEASK